MYKSISIISELINARQYELVIDVLGSKRSFPFELALKKLLIDVSPTNLKMSFRKSLFDKRKHIISLQMLLILLKKLLAHGDFSTLQQSDMNISREDYVEIIRLQLIVAEEFDSNFDENKVDIDHFIYANFHINNDRNVASEFVRSFYMFEKLSKDKSNFDPAIQAEYLNYYKVFFDKYSYTPTQYLSLLFWELSAYYPPINKLTFSSRWRNTETVYGETSMAQIGESVIRDLSKPARFYHDWAISTEKNMWDFSKFNEFPFVSINMRDYISISEYTLKNTFFEKLFWSIRNCFPRDDSRAMAFYGRLFERYVQDLSQNAIKKSKIYMYIHEFEYGADNKKSSDAYIRKGMNLLIVESKGYSILLNTIIENSDIQKNYNKLFVDPILQADRCFDEIDSLGDIFEKITDAYIISVTMDSINAVPEYLNSILDEINKGKHSKKAKCFFNFSIEEFEMLMYLVEQDIDIFEILNDYYTHDHILPFSEHLRSECRIQVKMTGFMSSLFVEARNMMLSMYKS